MTTTTSFRSRYKAEVTITPAESLIRTFTRGRFTLPFEGPQWEEAQQREFILSVLEGGPLGSMIINGVGELGLGSQPAERRLVDGVQRLRALVAFWDGELTLPVELFGDDDLAPNTKIKGGMVRRDNLSRDLLWRVQDASIPVFNTRVPVADEDKLNNVANP